MQVAVVPVVTACDSPFPYPLNACEDETSGMTLPVPSYLWFSLNTPEIEVGDTSDTLATTVTFCNNSDVLMTFWRKQNRSDLLDVEVCTCMRILIYNIYIIYITSTYYAQNMFILSKCKGLSI